LTRLGTENINQIYLKNIFSQQELENILGIKTNSNKLKYTVFAPIIKFKKN